MTRHVAFVWQQFAPYHVDRLRAVAEALGAEWRVHGVEIADRSDTYAWPPTPAGGGYVHRTLFPGQVGETTQARRRRRALWRAVGACDVVFLCNYERPGTLVLAWRLRLAGRRVILMFDSTRMDKPRRRLREAVKRLALSPYHGALVSGSASAAYLTRLGLPAGTLARGYDTLDVARVRREADVAPAPDGPPFEARVFIIVARLVARKDLATAIAAYGRYAAAETEAGRPPRELWICGDGPLRRDLEERVAALPAGCCRFLGFLAPAAVSRCLGHALALLLPSRSEPWGLAVNEALALGVPAIVSDRVGCAPDLIAAGQAGLIRPVGDVTAWAAALTYLARDRDLWHRLAGNARQHGGAGDVQHFVTGVRSLLDRVA